MKSLLVIAFVFILTSCSVMKEKVSSSEPFGKTCPMAMVHGKKVDGSDKHVLDYRGKKLYFASAESKAKFSKNIEENYSKASRMFENLIDK